MKLNYVHLVFQKYLVSISETVLVIVNNSVGFFHWRGNRVEILHNYISSEIESEQAQSNAVTKSLTTL